MNKQGISMAEALAVIVLTGIILILLGNIIQFFARSNNVIQAEETLSTEGLIIERKLSQTISNFGPNNAEYCTVGGVDNLQCVELMLDYHFTWDELTERMIMVDDDPDQIMTLEVRDGSFWIDNVAQSIPGTTVLDTSSFSIYKNGTTDTITLVIHLNLQGAFESTEEFVITEIITQT